MLKLGILRVYRYHKCSCYKKYLLSGVRVDKLPASIRRGDQKPSKGYERITETPERWYVPYSSINTLTQTRKNVDRDFIEELARGMIESDQETGEVKVNNYQPPRVGLFTKEQAEKYIKDLNETWDTEHSLDELRPLEDGSYLILIYGHQRMLAEDKAFGWLGRDSERQEIPVQLEDGSKIDFSNAVEMQFRENFHRRPESWEDAQAIYGIFKGGKYPTFAECARALAVSEERVARAHRYDTLPDEVKRLVEEGALSYIKALRLTDLFAVLAYDTFSGNLSEDERRAIAQKIRQNKYYLNDALKMVPAERMADLGSSFMSHTLKIIAELRTERDVALYVENTCHSILHADQLMLIALDESQKIQEELRLLRQEARMIAITSLRNIIALLATDEVRLEAGQDSILVTSKTTASLLEIVFRRLEVVGTIFEGAGNKDSLDAGKEVLRQLQEGHERDLVDEVSKAMAA